MFEYLEKIRALPVKLRKQFAFLFTAGTTLLISVVWFTVAISSIIREVQNMEQTAIPMTPSFGEIYKQTKETFLNRDTQRETRESTQDFARGILPPAYFEENVDVYQKHETFSETPVFDQILDEYYDQETERVGSRKNTTDARKSGFVLYSESVDE